MLNLLGELQDQYCCYCMRRINMGSDEATLEHIIPQSMTQTADMKPYFDLGYDSLSSERLIATREFCGLYSPDIPPRPHSVAYHNFALSCNGSFAEGGISMCCNNYRGNSFVNPVYLNEGVADMVEYCCDGEMRPVSGCVLYGDIVDMIKNTGLNCKNLKTIRRIWYALSEVGLDDILNLKREKDRKLLLLKYLDWAPKELNKLVEFYIEDTHWDLLMSYKWFHGKVSEGN
ncbi:MAG: hypothetical protein K2K29_04925 [Muribaculaceae bacterium]|nr:hypothetical protein [Muribaculaceae bacterium]